MTETLDQFKYVQRFMPRWRDNDQYGHINNAVYYEYFDSTANLFLIEEAGLQPQDDDIIAYVVYSQCQYLAPIAYPNTLAVGLSVKHIGKSSINWQLGLFAENTQQLCAIGEFVHVFVERASGQKSNIPPHILAKIKPLKL